MFANLTGWHLIIVLAIFVLLFGATKLPALTKSVGQSMRIFKNEMKVAKSETLDADLAAESEALEAEPVPRIKSAS